jgi:hypothetical protein
MGFRSTILDTAALARDPQVCCVLDSSLQFLYCNPAWDDFARQNGGTASTMGAALMYQRLLLYVPEILKPFFAGHLNNLRSGGGMWHHEYECSTPTHFCIYELQAVRLPDADEILICHVPLVRRPHTRVPTKPKPGLHGGPEVHMCCHCRCTRREDGSGIWDWIPDYLAKPPRNQIADLCPPCVEYYRCGGELALKA